MRADGGAAAVGRVRAAVRRLAADDGMTLAEMVVVMAVLGIVLAALSTLFVGGIHVQSYLSNRFEAQQNARLALDKLRHEIHCASAVQAAAFPASSVTFTVGGYCPTVDGTTLTSPLDPFAVTPYSISVGSTASFPPPPLKVYVGNSGRIDCTGSTAATVTGCTGGAPPSPPLSTYAVGTKVAATNNYTWCTLGSGSKYALYRYRGDSCSGTGIRWANYLTAANVFPASMWNCAAGELRTISVDLPVNFRPTQPSQRYELKDDIVLRNSGRTCP